MSLEPKLMNIILDVLLNIGYPWASNYNRPFADWIIHEFINSFIAEMRTIPNNPMPKLIESDKKGVTEERDLVSFDKYSLSFADNDWTGTDTIISI